MTFTTLRPCFKEVLSRHGQEHDMSARWIRRFLREINMTYRVASAAKQGDHLAEEVLDAQENLRYKLWWTVNEHGVSDKRIVNLDQTSIRVMPLRSSGWATSGGDRVKFLQDAKRQVTLCVACPMLAGQIIGQIVFTRKTKKAIPAVDMPANIACTASESHWSNTETMMEMFQAIAASVDSGPDAPIVVVLDCAPIHMSKEFRRRVREEMEWIKLVYVAPTHTATAQPLDVAYNFPLKASLTRVPTAHFSKLLLDAIESDDKGARQVDTRMSSLKPLLPHWVGVALNELSLRDDIREFGWRHLFVPAGEDRETVIAAAQELHEDGEALSASGRQLWRDPEEQPSDGEDPPAAAADEDGEEEEEEKELALLSPPPAEVDELEVEMELMEESMELPKEVMGEPMEETPNEPGTSNTAAPKAAPPPKVDKKTALLQKLVGLRLAYGHKPPPGM